MTHLGNIRESDIQTAVSMADLDVACAYLQDNRRLSRQFWKLVQSARGARGSFQPGHGRHCS